MKYRVIEDSPGFYKVQQKPKWWPLWEDAHAIGRQLFTDSPAAVASIKGLKRRHKHKRTVVHEE